MWCCRVESSIYVVSATQALFTWAEPDTQEGIRICFTFSLSLPHLWVWVLQPHSNLSIKTLIIVCAWICIAELAIAVLVYEVKFIIKPHQMVDNSFAVMNLLFILWSPLSPNSSTRSLFDPRGSGRREQFPAQRPLWISSTSRRRRRIVSIEIATSAWQAGLNYQPRCSPLLTTNLICIVTTHQHSSSDYFFLLFLY